MDIIRAIEERRSIRKFKDKVVPKEIIEKILELATKAPSERIVNHGSLLLHKITQKMKW